MGIYGLNPKQEEAVIAPDGPLLILAGAGSGKTRTLTHRIAYLISERHVNPYNILAVTFTNKAAGEMKERVRSIVGETADRMWVSTFHSACMRILRSDIDLLGYDERFTVYDTDDQKTVMKNVCKQQHNALPNGLIMLKGGDLQAEVYPFRKVAEVVNISDWFEEEFFKTKKIVYLPL